MPTKKKSNEPKTRPNRASVSAFLKKAAAGPRLADGKTLVSMMKTATGKKPIMWGDAMVGFDTYIVRYADGHEMEWPLMSFSPRKSSFVLYLGWKRHRDLLKKIGKHKTIGGCLYIKTLADVDQKVLQRLLNAAAKSRH